MLRSSCRFSGFTSFKQLYPRIYFQKFSSNPAGETVLSFKNVSFDYREAVPLLSEISFNVKEGSKVTIMGQNGSGKSTMMKLMNGLLKPSKGTINIKSGYALSRALQVLPIEDREKSLKDFFITHLHGQTSGIDGRIAKVLQQVELPDLSHSRVMKTFSGGQQARLLLASSLILEPDILLLDEPTNNLDKKGITLLSSLIKEVEKTCIVISHDEDFLNSFTDSVLYIDSGMKKIESYDGNYREVKKSIATRIQKENEQNARLQKEIEKKKIQAASFANKGGSNIRKAASKLKAQAEQLEDVKIVVRKEDKTLFTFNIPYQFSSSGSYSSSPIRSIIISAINLPRIGFYKDYSLTPIVIEKGNHVRIKGPNGIGKTTFLEGMVNKTLDNVEIASSLTIGYYRQDFHNLDFDSTVLETLHNASGGKHNEQHIRKTAATFFLLKDMMTQEVRTLSEGQKGLLSLASLVLQEPGLLILDEPTNHINFRHLPILAKAFNEFEGTLLVVSHDEDFIKKMKIHQEINLAAK
jgi:ATPase subunit of ABC transporter with duplicated ATPase domains